MPGLTAKVFRTYNASITMARLLKELKGDNRPIAEKVKLYNDCNRQVAILCNHKRTVGASHEQQMEKLGDKIKAYQYKKWRAKQMILDLDSKQKKKKGAEWFAMDPELTEEWILEHQEQLVEKERENIQKKFQKENEKRAAEGEKPLPDKELKERLKAANELQAKFKKENKSKKVAAEGRGVTVEKLEAQIVKHDTQISNLRLQAEDREGNKEVALSTSKLVSRTSPFSVYFFYVYPPCLMLTMVHRITSTPVLRSSSLESSTFLLRSSSRRRCGRSLIGPSSQLKMMTGTSNAGAVERLSCSQFEVFYIDVLMLFLPTTQQHCTFNHTLIPLFLVSFFFFFSFSSCLFFLFC